MEFQKQLKSSSHIYESYSLVCISNDVIARGGSNGTIYVKDLAVISDELLASSSLDTTVHIWNVTTYNSKFTSLIHTLIMLGA